MRHATFVVAVRICLGNRNFRSGVCSVHPWNGTGKIGFASIDACYFVFVQEPASLKLYSRLRDKTVTQTLSVVMLLRIIRRWKRRLCYFYTHCICKLDLCFWWATQAIRDTHFYQRILFNIEDRKARQAPKIIRRDRALSINTRPSPTYVNARRPKPIHNPTHLISLPTDIKLLIFDYLLEQRVGIHLLLAIHS